MINFKLAQLRKKHNMTQQQIGDILNVSYQTISKWENNVVLPDITMLPLISNYFGVSVDALLGLVPLEPEYQPSGAGTSNYWEKRLEYLKRTRKTMWNEDYFQFLVRDVWKIDKPVSVLDCGCGYGALGLLLMTCLPDGSKYTGVDFAGNMIAAARETFSYSNGNDKNSVLSAEFICSDIMEFEPGEQYDIVISQALLRHVDNGEKFLHKMIGFLKKDGMLVSLEPNLEHEKVGLYIEGMDYMDLCEHDGLKKMWHMELKMQNRDYSIAMKIPHYMKAAGLHNVSCRMNDRVNFLEPEQLEYEEMLDSCIRMDHWVEEVENKELEETIISLMNRGMDRKEAEAFCRQQNGIVRFLQKNKGEVALTKFSGMMISYGWK